MINDPRMKGRPAGMPPPPMDDMFTSTIAQPMPTVAAAGMEAGSPLGGIVEPNAAVPPPLPPEPAPVAPLPLAAAAAPQQAPLTAPTPSLAPASLFPGAGGDQSAAIQRKLRGQTGASY